MHYPFFAHLFSSNQKLHMNNIILSIPDPCTQDWNEMAPTEKGKFCSHCSTEVIDFTRSSDNEIIAYMEKHRGKLLCGQFDADQLNRRLISSNIKKTNPALYKYLISILLITASQSAAAQEIKKEEIVAVPIRTNACEGFIESPPFAALNKPVMDTPVQRPRIILGMVRTQPKNEPMVIIDGIPVKSSVLNTFPPQKIKRVDVLKDGEATALFGSEGVYAIVITTNFTERERRRFMRKKHL